MYIQNQQPLCSAAFSLPNQKQDRLHFGKKDEAIATGIPDATQDGAEVHCQAQSQQHLQQQVANETFDQAQHMTYH